MTSGANTPGWTGGTGCDLHARTRPGLCGLRPGMDQPTDRNAMSNGQEELLNLHGPLTSDAQKQPEYRDNTETAIYGYSEGVEHALETVWIKGYRKPRNGAAAVTGMENVLAEHYDVELEHGYWSCICGERFGVLLPDELHRAHVAEALTLAGFGNLHDAWADGANYSAAHPIANMADRDRVNPYRTQL